MSILADLLACCPGIVSFRRFWSSAGLMSVLACLPGVAFGQQADDDPVLAVWEAFEETFSCQRCHYESQPIPNARFGDRPPRDAGDLSRQNEMYRWVRDDKHAIARIRIEPLRVGQVEAEQRRISEKFHFPDPSAVRNWVGPSNELSRRICDALGYDVDSDVGYSRFAEACLTCHGGYNPSVGQHAGFGKPADLTQTQPGISCLGCHQEPAGTGQTNDAWSLTHASLNDPRRTEWRLLPPDQKASLGMRDLVKVSKQAELCIDCHVGNISRGMFVTHAMYAAGHPPLPNFELETFCRQMPQHWRSEAEQLQAFSEANYPGKSAYFEVNFPGMSDGMHEKNVSLEQVAWNTRRSIVGAATVRRRNAEMVVWAAQSEHWGDYAMYDCGACHHELQRPSLRQQRGYPGAPGRPRLHEWPDVMLLAVSPSSAAAVRQEKLVAAVSDVPFGNPLKCRNAAAELLKELDLVVQKVEDGFVITSSLSWKLIEQLSDLGRENLLDYATARQVMWMIEAAASDLARISPLSPTDARRLSRVQAELDLWGASEVPRAGVVADGQVGIATRLPAGRDMFIYRENLHLELERRATYQPTALAESLHRILNAVR